MKKELKIKELERKKEYFKDSDLDGVIDIEDLAPENPYISSYENLEKEKKEKEKTR